jgi:hypothetical protein
MKTLSNGRSAAVRVVVSALMACVGLFATAFAQDLTNLDPAKKVIAVNAGADQTVEAGTGVVGLHPVMTGYVSEDPVMFYWVNTATGITEQLGDTTMQAPRQDTTYRLVGLNNFSGEWGEDFMTVHVTDTTPPQIWLLGDPTVYVTTCTPYMEPGVGVFDNADGASVPITITGQVNTSVVGAYTLTYTATDQHNNTASVVRTVNVIYSWSGFQNPVDPAGKTVFKLGRTLPLKFQLTGTCASKVDLVARLYLAKVSDGIVGTEIAPESLVAADFGNVFKYQGGTYHYNLSTKGLSAGTWQLRVDLGDGAPHAVLISLTN